jgi:hypothetical protein
VTVKHISTFAKRANNREKHTETKNHNINAEDDIRALSAKINGSRSRIIIVEYHLTFRKDTCGRVQRRP